MVKLQLDIARHVTGFVHVQTNPFHSYDTEKTIADAKSKLSFSY
jgi:transaldolase